MVQPNSQVIPIRELDGREGSDPKDEDWGPVSDNIVGKPVQSTFGACLPVTFYFRLGIGAGLVLICLAIVNLRLSTVESRITALQDEGKKSGSVESRMTGVTSRVQALEREEGKNNGTVESSMTGVTSRSLALTPYRRLTRNNYSIVYNHMPKAGGSFVRRVLERLMPSDVKIEIEKRTVTKHDVQHFFTMGSVRNPCEYYTSLYNYGAQVGRSAMRKYVGPAWYKQNDPNQFRKWLRHVTGASKLGVMSYRFAVSYIPGQQDSEPSGPVSSKLNKAEQLEKIFKHWNSSSISCWVKTENVVGTLQNCLRQYELERSKPVNWSRFDHLVASTWHNPSNHFNCSYFYDNATKAFVMERDKYIFSKFGYAGCCES